MSSPIAIPRASTSSSASASSPTGLYIPIHKRTPSAASPARPESPPRSPQRKAYTHREPCSSRHAQRAEPQACRSPSPRAHAHAPATTASPRSSPAPIPTPKIPTTSHIPTQSSRPTSRPNTYPISTLLALSRSPLVGLTPAQLEHITALHAAMLPAAPKPGEQPVRRRRAGRKVKNAKMLAQQADLESRRKRHGAAWHGELHPAGDAAPVALDGLHESWRAPRVVAVHA